MTFASDYDYLIHIINSVVNKRKPQEKPDNISFKKVLNIARGNEVANIAYLGIKQLDNKPSEEVLNKWKMMFSFSVQRHYNQMALTEFLINKFTDANIRSLQVQGSIIKKLYPQPEYRMMSDIDFIVGPENMDKVAIMLNDMGYSVIYDNPEELQATTPQGLVIEAHADFFGKGTVCGDVFNNAFSMAEKSKENQFVYTADDTVVYMYNLLHTLKHYLNKGIGIRRILDIYYMDLKLSDKVDMEYINSVIKKAGLEQQTAQLFALAKFWFADVEPEIDLSNLIHIVRLSGNHGSDAVSIKREYDKFGKKNGVAFKCKKCLSLFFPTKEKMYASYPEFSDKGYSYMSCWVRRAYGTVTKESNRDRAIDLLKKIYIFKTK